jgi:hypothetical protein
MLMPKLTAAVSRVRTAMFDEGGLEAVFQHVRNIITTSVVAAAGVYTIRNGELLRVWGTWDDTAAGYSVAVVGVVLFTLNLLDGLHRLAKLRWHFTLQIVLVLIYLMVTVRIAHLVLSFRAA